MLLYKCKKCTFSEGSLTHAHMRARINAFIVCIDKQSFFYQTVQPAKSSVRFDFHLFSLLQQLCTGELVAHYFKKRIPVGIGSMFDLCGRKKR